MNCVGVCEKGLCRDNNQDSIFMYNTRFGCLPNLYIVADGMGGHKAGEIASSLSIEYFKEFIHENRDIMLCEHYEYLDIIKKAILYANSKIYEKSLSDEQYEGMGTTFVTATFVQNKLLVSNIGDSRLYLIRDNELIQITVDHTYIMELYKNGEITQDELINHPNKNVITRAVGTDKNIDIDNFEIELYKEDYILICSDGLSTMVNDSDILAIFNKNSDIKTMANELLELANSNGGNDNISIILINNFFEEVK